jgi:short subunit fatty acids transporter
VIVVARILMPRQGLPVSRFPDAHALAAADDAPAATGEAATTAGFAAWIERSPLVIAVLVAALLSWLYHHFVTKGSRLDLNAMNTMLLAVALALHRSPAAFSRVIRGAVTVCGPVIVLYHLYAGVAGLLQFTSVGERLAGAFAAWSTPRRCRSIRHRIQMSRSGAAARPGSPHRNRSSPNRAEAAHKNRSHRARRGLKHPTWCRQASRHWRP